MDNSKDELLQQLDKWYVETRQRLVDNTCTIEFDWHIDIDDNYVSKRLATRYTLTTNWYDTEFTNG